MSTPTDNTPTKCPECGAPLYLSVDGMCGACLLRLATLDPEPEALTLAPTEGLEEWLKLKGQRVAGYELLDEIARGGMGIVYRARQLAAGRTVALKLMLPHLIHLPGMEQRFRHEVAAVAQLDHPGILPVYEVGDHGGLPFFSMKFAEGGSLDRHVLALRGDWNRIARVVQEVANAVEFAHAKGILHRDLKPANILFDANGAPMVGDFGLAKFRAVEHGLTVPTSAFGSPNYMAPEQISAQFGEPGPATDVYGLGAVLYELLTGQPPIQGEDAAATMRLVSTQEPRPGLSIRVGIPADLDAIALKCLAKLPGERYASAAALAADLQKWLDGGVSSARRLARSQKARRLTEKIGGGALLITLAVLGGRYFFANHAAQAERAGPVTSSLPAARSVAVLPLRNLGANADDEYLSAMVTDDLLRELRQVVSLSVVPFRLTVDERENFRPADLLEKLGVDLVLDGDFARQDDVLHVRARLWDTKLQRATWQHEFDTPAADVREMRSEIATALVTQMQIQVGSDLREQLRADALTNSPEAYSKYLRARYLLRWRRHETLSEAAKLLREAIALDDKFAQAHSALAYVYALWIPPAPAEGPEWQLAVQYAHSALARNVALSEPHAVLGDYHSRAGNPIDAELDFQHALKLDARDPATLHFYAIHLYGVGRLKDALAMERRSVANDSNSPQPMMWLAMATTLAGDPEEARRLWQKTDELGASKPLCAAVTRLEIGQNEPLMDWYEAHPNDFNPIVADGAARPADTRAMADLHAGVLDAKRRAPALRWLKQAEPFANKGFLITHYGLLGDADDALRLAENFNLVDDSRLLYQLCNIWSPHTAVIRADPRFAKLVKRWGFVDYWQRFGAPEFCSIEGGEARCR